VGTEIAEKDAHKALLMEIAGHHFEGPPFLSKSDYHCTAYHCSISLFPMQQGGKIKFLFAWGRTPPACRGAPAKKENLLFTK